jgi:anti-sigma regulatory factor (Ser/Thr protein kinase)
VGEAVISGRRGRQIGAVTVRTAAGHPLPDDRRALLAPVARILGTLAEGTWRLGREEQIGRTVRLSLLPDPLPDVDGWQLAARYLPGAAQVEAGGDWYDVIALPGGGAVVCIGEVAGQGLGAAVTTAQLREVTRAYAEQDPSPAKILDRLSTLIAAVPTGSFGTLLLGRLDPVDGVLTWCSAGHPVPVRSEPGGAARWLEGPVGPPLGVLAGDHVENRVVLAPGARLLFCTDALAEDPDRMRNDGRRRLPEMIESVPAGASPAALIDAVLAGTPTPRADDLAVMAVERRADGHSPPGSDLADLEVGWTYPAVPTAASMMRRDLRGTLGGHGVEQELLDDLTVAASEAVNNAVEHAQRPSRPEVQVRVRVRAGTVRVTVRDFGSWRGRQAAMDRGRGAMLMNAYGDVRVIPTPDGTTVIIERRLRSTPDGH